MCQLGSLRRAFPVSLGLGSCGIVVWHLSVGHSVGVMGTVKALRVSLMPRFSIVISLVSCLLLGWTPASFVRNQALHCCTLQPPATFKMTIVFYAGVVGLGIAC